VDTKYLSVGLPARLVVIAALALVALAVPRVARADSNGNAAYNFAVGGGLATNNLGTADAFNPSDQSGIGAIKFAFSAHCQVAGPATCTADPTILAPAPTGHVVLTLEYGGGAPDTKFQGPVTCLNVEGNSAGITFVDETTGQPVSITTVDNGTSAQVGAPSALYVGPSPSPYTCDQFTNLYGSGGFVIKGNVVVNEGSFLPCTPMTDNTTYMIDSNCNLYVMTPNGWQVVQ